MSKLSNTITMLELLNTGKKYTINELSQILEVSERMIRIYKEDLEKAGIYIDTIYGPYGGYILNNSVKLPKRKFKKSDYEFLMNLKVNNNEKEKLNEIIDKIRGVYFGSKEETIEIDELSKPIYNILTRSIKEKRKVEILYYSYNKGYKKRVIHPFDMFYLSNGWGCAAFCELRNDYRHFELRRIKEIKLLDEFFK